MSAPPRPIIDCDIHPYPSPQHPVEPFIPKEFREAVRIGMDVAPGSGHANPFGVNRRDANCIEPKDVARDHLDKYNIAFGVLQPPGMNVSLTRNIDVGAALGRAWNEWQVATFQAHLISLVLEGTFEKFPRLKVMLIEGGVCWLAHTLWRMDKNFKALRAMVPWLKRRPSEYVFDHVRLTTQPLEEPDRPEHL